MRILHILNDVTDRGNGIVNTAVDLAIEQVRQGHVVSIASAGGGYESLLSQSGVQHLLLDQSRGPRNLTRALMRLRHHLRNFSPEIVHAHMRTGLLLARLWARVYSYALVSHVHNVHDRESIIMGLADRVIAVSQSVAVTMAAQGVNKNKIRVVLNRTLNSPRQPNLQNIQPAQLLHPAIVTVAGMNHRKGIAELISAFDTVATLHPDVNLYLVGDGPERTLFEDQARHSPSHARIHFTGFQAVPQSYMLAADIFVLASRRESFGLVLIEARQAGCAIIASDIDGISEALDNGRAGFLVPTRNVPALAGAIEALLADDQQRRWWQQQASKGIDAFRVNAMATEVEKIYRDLIGTQPNIVPSHAAISKQNASATSPSPRM